MSFRAKAGAEQGQSVGLLKEYCTYSGALRKTLDNNDLNQVLSPAVLVKTTGIWLGAQSCLLKKKKTWSRSTNTDRFAQFVTYMPPIQIPKRLTYLFCIIYYLRFPLFLTLPVIQFSLEKVAINQFIYLFISLFLYLFIYLFLLKDCRAHNTAEPVTRQTQDQRYQINVFGS